MRTGNLHKVLAGLLMFMAAALVWIRDTQAWLFNRPYRRFLRLYQGSAVTPDLDCGQDEQDHQQRHQDRARDEAEHEAADDRPKD